MDLAHLLAGLTGSEVELLESRAPAFSTVLSLLSKNERLFVHREWLQRVGADPILAVGILLWTSYGASLADRGASIVIEAATPRLLGRRDLRNDLRKMLLADSAIRCSLPYSLSRALQSDEDDDRRSRDESVRGQSLKAQACREYCQVIADMPFELRVPAIRLNDNLFSSRAWVNNPSVMSTWTECTATEMDGLSAESTQKLIDLCEESYLFRRSEVLKRLYDRRHQLRHISMDDIRRKHSSMSSRDLLTELVLDGSVPVEHFPVELAKEVTSDWFSALPAKRQGQFVAQLAACKLRVWVRASKNIPLVSAGE